MHWRKPRVEQCQFCGEERAGSCSSCRWSDRIAFLQVVAMLLALGLFCTAMNSMASRERTIVQAPPYYECNGPKATRHPRCDRD